jgi:hypothetical protein
VFRSLLAAACFVCLIARVETATEAYLNLLSPEQRKLSDQYFEGGYWLQLWDLRLYRYRGCAIRYSVGSVLRCAGERLCSFRKAILFTAPTQFAMDQVSRLR